MPLSPLAVRDLIVARLRTQTNLDVIDGTVDADGEPTYRLDGDGRIHMSALLRIGAGTPVTETEALDTTAAVHSLTWYVHAVGGDQDRCLKAHAKIRAALTGHRLAPTLGITRELLEGAYVPIREADPAPARWSLPVLYRTENG